MPGRDDHDPSAKYLTRYRYPRRPLARKWLTLTIHALSRCRTACKMIHARRSGITTTRCSEAKIESGHPRSETAENRGRNAWTSGKARSRADCSPPSFLQLDAWPDSLQEDGDSARHWRFLRHHAAGAVSGFARFSDWEQVRLYRRQGGSAKRAAPGRALVHVQVFSSRVGCGGSGSFGIPLPQRLDIIHSPRFRGMSVSMVQVKHCPRCKFSTPLSRVPPPAGRSPSKMDLSTI